jgi:hypothetical protein
MLRGYIHNKQSMELVYQPVSAMVSFPGRDAVGVFAAYRVWARGALVQYTG